MLIFLILIIMLVVGIFIIRSQFGDIGFILIVISSIMIISGLIALPINYCETKAKIKQFQATKTTYENIRKHTDAPFQISIEKAAIQVDIAGQNRWLVSIQYWNDTMFDIWIPDAVMDLKLLE